MGYTTEKNKYVNSKESIIFDDFTLDTKFVDFPYMVKSSAIKILTLKDVTKDNIRFNFELLSNHKFNMLGHARHYISVVQPEEVFTPNKQEQDKIGELFTNLDNLITLHQRKFNDILVYKLSKKFLLLKFTKNVWEQRKLEEIVDFYRGRGLSWNDINEDGVNKCILYGNLYTDYGMVINEVLRTTNCNKMDYFLSEVGDVLIPSSDTTPTGLARASSLNLKGIILGGDINVLRPKTINGTFLSYSINNNKKELIKRIKGTTVRHLNNSDIKDMDLYISNNLNEQVKIANLLTDLDSLITLHHRKYTYIFYSWEQRKLGDITQIIMGQSPDSINYTNNSDDTILIQGNADLNNGIVVPRIWSSQITKKSYPNDIIFTVRAPVGEIARNPYFATIGRGVASFKGNDFLYQSLIRKKENNYWNNISAGSTFDSINSVQLKNVIIDLPKNDAEQDKIGELFTNLDNLITLHQHKELKRRNDNNEHLRW